MRAKIEGFLVYDFMLTKVRTAHRGFCSMDYQSQFAAAEKEMAQWILDGRLKRKYHVVEGLANAPEAINLLFTGGNTGKLYVFI